MGDPLVDEYLRFTAARVRPNSLVAQAFDLKIFFAVVAKPPPQVDLTEVLGFIEEQRAPCGGGSVVWLIDGEAGLAASTIKRRLATISAFFDYPLCAGCATATLCCAASTPVTAPRGSPLVRAPKKMPRVLSPDEVHALTSALRTDRDRAMISLMVHAGLRRCEVLGLRLGDVHIGDRRVFIANGKSGHQRLVPVVPTFCTQLASYLSAERPGDAQCGPRTTCSSSSRAPPAAGR